MKISPKLLSSSNKNPRVSRHLSVIWFEIENPAQKLSQKRNTRPFSAYIDCFW